MDMCGKGSPKLKLHGYRVHPFQSMPTGVWIQSCNPLVWVWGALNTLAPLTAYIVLVPSRFVLRTEV